MYAPFQSHFVTLFGGAEIKNFVAVLGWRQSDHHIFLQRVNYRNYLRRHEEAEIFVVDWETVGRHKVIEEVGLSFEMCVVYSDEVNAPVLAAELADAHSGEVRTNFYPEIFVIAISVLSEEAFLLCSVVTELEFRPRAR